MNQLSQFASGFACVMLLAAPANGADADLQSCAVSNFNGKLEGAGGFIETDASDGGRGHGALSVSLPLGCMFGLQIDGTGGVLDNEETGGVAAHLFLRDPSTYLLGLYGEYSIIGSNDIGRVGGEAELYLDQFSISGLVGFEDSDLTNNDVFGAAQLSYYFTENFQVNAGFAHFLDVSAGTIGAEWQLSETSTPLPISLFVHGAIGDNDYATVFGGVRFYFGGGHKSLIRRHREDDPPSWANRMKSLIDQPATSTPDTGGGGEGGGEV